MDNIYHCKSSHFEVQVKDLGYIRLDYLET
jgi:hypothetical protein